MIRSRLARDKATDLLRLYNINSAPISLDLVCEKLGFKIIPYDFPESISALFIIEEGIKAIGVNKNHSPARKRFSIAHELGHFVSGHEDFNHEEVSHIDREKKYLNRFHRMEEEADEFAAEVLMPEFLLKNDYRELSGNIEKLAKKYLVSQQAMTIQLLNLKLLG
jgi:Zn-dependent peptidase ImmA (M78 family)